MIELRLRTKRTDEWCERVAATFVTPQMIGVQLTSTWEPIRVLRPDGLPLCVYLPGGAKAISDEKFAEFKTIRGQTTNRGYASGSDRKFLEGAGRGRTAPITSSILGSFDPSGAQQYCRLTAFTARQVERWESLMPYFHRISDLLEEHVPARYANQMREAQRTNPDWVIDGTPFTTITINNTYPTAVHTDKGDLDVGFSTLGCMRQGDFVGGHLTFPQYGVSVDMQHGDVLLMDAHDWHGNTPIRCTHCGEKLRKYDHRCGAMDAVEEETGSVLPSPERVSVVSYFRTKMVGCDALEDENAKRLAIRERWTGKAIGLTEEEDDISIGDLQSVGAGEG